MLSTATEESPLLGRDEEAAEPPYHVLVEVIGAQYLLAAANTVLEPYCVAKFGTKTIHKTRVTKGTDPVWTLKSNSLFILTVSPNDIANNKNLTVTVWARRQSSALHNVARNVVSGTKEVQFHGKIQVGAADILSYCNEERTELNLKDELGQDILNSSKRPVPAMALRFRVASEQDVRFVQAWNQYGRLDATTLKGTGVIEDENRTMASLISEQDESQVLGATLMTAISNTLASSPQKKIRVKPHRDPKRPDDTNFMRPTVLKTETAGPSHSWVESGTGSVGRLYLEILSCHNLPNIDVGSTIGNLSDPFVCAVYEDSVVQTPFIDDELSPLWPPWTQRAFVFNMMHPSSVLYLAVFGYKKGLFNHRPLGRAEINPGNMQRDTVYNLRYNLSPSSHVMDRTSSGTIRVRLRMEINDERAALMTSLKPLPTIYINVEKQKSFPIVRYTCRGEYDNENRFDLQVLSAYREELLDGYLRRIVYTLNDASQSLFFWRGQVQIGPVWFPLHSLILFCTGVLLVEKPQLFPAFIPLSIAWFMLAHMYWRRLNPSPWGKCLTFGHYFRILVLGHSSHAYEKIKPWQGHAQSNALAAAKQQRIAKVLETAKKKETVEVEIKEVEKRDTLETQVQELLDIELVKELGKVQGMVGGICRLLRSIHVVIWWEESAVSFWVTVLSLAVGMLFLFLPWVFIFTWTGRIAVFGLLGPHMKLVDLMRKSRDNKNIPEILAERMFHARRRQEEAVKLKAFRGKRFGKYSTRVPGISWTPHCDIPLPESDAQLMKDSSASYREFPTINSSAPCVPGQQLYGLMIPRPKNQLLRNQEAALKEKARAEAIALSAAQKTPTKKTRFEESVRDEGVEVAFEEKPFSARASSYFSNLFWWQKSPAKAKRKSSISPVRKKSEDDVRLSKFCVEVTEDVGDEGSLSQQKLKNAASGDDLWFSSMGFEVDDILDEETLAQLQNSENQRVQSGDRTYDLSVSSIGFEVDDILAEEQLHQQDDSADVSEASITDEFKEPCKECADESEACMPDESKDANAERSDESQASMPMPDERKDANAERPDESQASMLHELKEASAEHANESATSITNDLLEASADHLIDHDFDLHGNDDKWWNEDNICISEAQQQREGSIRLGSTVSNESVNSTADQSNAMASNIENDEVRGTETAEQSADDSRQVEDGAVRVNQSRVTTRASARNESVHELGVELLEEYDEEALLFGSKSEQSPRDVSENNEDKASTTK